MPSQCLAAQVKREITDVSWIAQILNWFQDVHVIFSTASDDALIAISKFAISHDYSDLNPQVFVSL